MIKTNYQKNFIVKRVLHNSQELVQELSFLEERCLPFQMCHANNSQYFSTVLNNPSNISLLLHYKGRLVGFLLAKKYYQAYKELINHDPDLKSRKDNAYFIETIQIHPQFRKKGGFDLLIEKLLLTIKKEKIQEFCLYARRKNSFSSFVQKRFFGQKIRTVENWLGFGEAFDYLEIKINKNLLEKLIKFFSPSIKS